MITEHMVRVTGRDDETYEILPTENLLRYLRRLAEKEILEQELCIEMEGSFMYGDESEQQERRDSGTLAPIF